MKITSIRKQFKKHQLIILLSIIAFIFRIYKGSEWFFWNVDEDFTALTVKRILVDHRPQLIGFPVPGGIYIGPFFYYLISIPYFLSRLSPFGLPLFAALGGTIASSLVYKVAKLLFKNDGIAILATLIYALSFLVNVYTRVFTALTIAPILGLLVYLILYQNINKKQTKNILWLALILAIASQNEGSSFSLIALTLVVWIIYKFKIAKKQLFQACFLFFSFQIPLLIFDLRHNFFLTKSLIDFIARLTSSHNNFSVKNPLEILLVFPQTLSRMLFISGPKDITDQILPCADLIENRLAAINPVMLSIAIVILTFFILIQFTKRGNFDGIRIISLHLLLGFAGILVYNLFLPGYIHEWTMVILFPAFAILTAYFLVYLLKKGLILKIPAILLFVSFIIYNLNSFIRATNHFGLISKVEAVKFAVGEIGNKPYFLDSLGSCYAQGYVYLFYHYGHLPIKSYADKMLSSTIFSDSEPEPTLGVVMVNPSRYEDEKFWEKYNFYKSQAVKSQKVNEIEVLIVEKTTN